MTSYVEQDRRPQRIQWRLALGAIAGILALGIVWLPSRDGTALLLLKVGCTLALWAFVLTELAITGNKVRQARAAERRAEHSRQVLAEALDVLPQAIAIFDPADRPILVNQRFIEIQGPSSPAASTRPARDPATDDSEHSLSDGRWVRIDGHRTRNGYKVTASSDVTELKQQKAELARRSRLLEATLNASDRGICIWGPDGHLTMWNGQVASLLDLPAELLTAGRPFAEFEAFLKARGESALAGAVAAIEPDKVPQARVRYEHLRPDGHVLDVICASLPDGGQMISYGDITAFRRVERDLREGEERFRRLSSATREGVLVHNGAVIIDANDAALALLDRSLAELVGRSAERLIEPADYAALRDTFECGKTEHHEAWFLRPDGSRFLCEVSQRLVPCRGRAAGVLTFHDITGYRWIEDQLRWARQQAEAESRSNSDFLAVMGQGLRTPLGGILGTIRQLSESRLTDDQRQRLQTIAKSVEGMIGTLDDIQDLARIEGGRQQTDDAFDLIDLVESVVGPLAAQATVKGIDLVSSVAANVPRAVRGDARRLRQVLTTLIENAVKFTDQGGVSLSLTASSTDISSADGGTMAELRFEVADTGIGITPAAQIRIFEGDTGSGIGLAIAKRLVELMGGDIGFYSAPNVGSHFWFTVTLERRQEETPDAADRDFSGIRVLLVEGNGASRKALARQLIAWKATVHAVPDAAAALAAVEGTNHHAPFDAALIDNQDADLPVDTLAHRLCDAGIGRLILLCPPGPPVDWQRLEAAGFSSVLHKPARQAKLAAALSGDRIVETGSAGINADTPLPHSAAPAKDTPKLAGTSVPDNASEGSAQAGNARRLLLVEDSVTNQLVASTLLKIAGYRVDIASNGVEAVKAVKATPFDLILMDIAMPEMDGITATKAIRALPAPAGRTPIIAMTANAMVGDRERFLAAGMNDYVPKPIERPYLLATIIRWLPTSPASPDQPSGAGISTSAIPAAPANEPQKDDVLDIAVLEQLRHDLDEIVLPDLIDAFLSEARQRCLRMAEAVATGNLIIVEREAHTLKSSAGTFGAAKLVRAVQTMERTCRETDMAEVERLSGLILSLVEEAVDAYRNLGLVSAPATEMTAMTQ